MVEAKLNLKCKDFDAWKSFLGRIAKIGHDYIIKNDIYLATVRNYKPSSTDKYPGKHMIRDPLFMDDSYAEYGFVEDGVYMVHDIDQILSEIKRAEENDPNGRKSICYYHSKTGIELQMGNCLIEIATLLTDIPDNIKPIADSITWFDALTEPIKDMEDIEWVPFTEDELIHLRNNGILNIGRTVQNREVATRLARSLFCLAGVTRLDNPIALAGKYTMIPSQQSDVAILRMHMVYKCGQSLNITVDTIHEYLILIYNQS